MAQLGRTTLVVQGMYYALTGIWPVLSMKTFEWVTGPKTDDWLVQMVGILAAVIGATLLTGAMRQTLSLELLLLAVGSALGFTAIDVVFSLTEVISPIYLVDAVIQVVLMTTLVLGWAKRPLRG